MINLLKHFNNSRTLPSSVMFYHSTNNPRWTSCAYEPLTNECFLKNVIAFRAISLISRGISSIPMSLQINESSAKSLPNHRLFPNLSDIFNRPNPQQSRGAFFESLVNYLLISGNAFIHFDESSDQLMCLRSDRIQIVPNSAQNDIDHYLYRVDSSQFKIACENLLHIKFFHPLNDWYGLSPLQVASQAIDQHNEISAHNIAILQNGGRPSGCLTVKSNMTDSQRGQLTDKVRSIYAGPLNAGKIAVLEGEFEWKEMGLSPKDLDFTGGKDLTTREIAQAFGVPPILVGLRGDSGFSNYREARLHLWEDTILPLAELIRLEISNWMSRRFQSEIEITFDLDKVHALTSRRDILWQKISAADFLTINEKRELLGFPPLSDSEIAKHINGEKEKSDNNTDNKQTN